MATWKKLLHESSPAADFPSAITTQASTATALHTGRTFLVDLDETNASTSFTGAANCTDIGVTNTLGVANGGTNTASYTAGDILYASGATTLTKLAVGTNGHVLTLSSGVPAWSAGAAGDVTGIDAGAGITIGDPSTATPSVGVTAANVNITSLTNAALTVGRDSDNLISFGTDNVIAFTVDGTLGFKMKASGEFEATSLDISGDADIDGTMEADAITIGGTAIGSIYSPVAGHSSIVTVGDITTGQWSATSIPVGNTDAKCTDANADQTSANTCDTPHVATNISWTAGTTAGPVCNSSTGSDVAIPVAASGASGVVTTGTQTMAGAKTFTGAVTMGSNLIVDGNISVSGTSTITNTQVETIQVADSMIKLRAGTGAWRDQGFVFDRGGVAVISSEGVVQTAAKDGCMWYDAATGHFHVGGVPNDLNEDDTTEDDISSVAENIHTLGLCSSSTSAPAGYAPIGSIHIDTDDDSGTPYMRII